jgi:translation initiation factor 3 subunit B
VEPKTGYDNTIVIDGVPIIDNSKLDKLLAKISKEFGKRGAPFKVDKAHVPWDEATGKCAGCVVTTTQSYVDAQEDCFR